MPFVYIVMCSDGTLYTGWAVDVEARVKLHNAGRGSIYCARRRPVRLLYREELPTLGEAMRRELAIKRLPRRGKLQLIQSEARIPLSQGEPTGKSET